MVLHSDVVSAPEHSRYSNCLIHDFLKKKKMLHRIGKLSKMTKYMNNLIKFNIYLSLLPSCGKPSLVGH